MVDEQSYDPVVPVKVGNRRGFRKERPQSPHLSFNHREAYMLLLGSGTHCHAYGGPKIGSLAILQQDGSRPVRPYSPVWSSFCPTGNTASR